MSQEDFDDLEFEDVLPRSMQSARAPLELTTTLAGRSSKVSLTLSMTVAVLSQWATLQSRVSVAYAPKQKLIRLMVDTEGRFEIRQSHLARTRERCWLRFPAPPGLGYVADTRFEPEYYVDAERRRMHLEVPESILRAALPVPQLKVVEARQATAALPSPDVPARRLTDAGRSLTPTPVPPGQAGLAAALSRSGQKMSLSQTEALIVEQLVRREISSRTVLAMAASIDPTSVDLTLVKLRPKLDLLGVTVENVRGEGWRISSKAKEFLRQLALPVGADPAPVAAVE